MSYTTKQVILAAGDHIVLPGPITNVRLLAANASVKMAVGGNESELFVGVGVTFSGVEAEVRISSAITQRITIAYGDALVVDNRLAGDVAIRGAIRTLPDIAIDDYTYGISGDAVGNTTKAHEVLTTSPFGHTYEHVLQPDGTYKQVEVRYSELYFSANVTCYLGWLNATSNYTPTQARAALQPSSSSGIAKTGYCLTANGGAITIRLPTLKKDPAGNLLNPKSLWMYFGATAPAAGQRAFFALRGGYVVD